MQNALPLTRSWRPSWPCSPALALGPYRHGTGDPTFVAGADGSLCWARRTPEGTATLRVAADKRAGVVNAEAWGSGAAWTLDHLPRLLGADDDPSGFVPPPELNDAWNRFGHWRIGASDLVFESLLPVILEQKVTGQEAFAAYRRLVLRFGEAAPGPAELRVRLAPDAATIAQLPSWEWLKLPVDQGRSRPAIEAARVVGSLERAADRGSEDLDRALRSLGGLGVWTSAEVRSRVLGDSDTVSFGDYHMAKDVGWALLGRTVDDEELKFILEPYRPHRFRIQGLVQLANLGRERRGPRMAPRRHLPGGYR